jgi:hypothetical protein
MKTLQPPDGGLPPRRRKAPMIIGAAVFVVGLVATIGFALNNGVLTPGPDAAQQSAETATTTPAPTPPPPLAVPAPSPAPLGDEAVSVKAVDDAAANLIVASNEILQRADGQTDGLENVAAGFVWGEMQALATERQQQGYKQVGKAKITSTTVKSVDLAATPPTAVLDVCIDASGIDVIDANGESLKGQLYQSSTPTLNVYGAEFIDGLWKLVTHNIPDTPDGAPCA